MLSPSAIFELKIHQNAFTAGVSPRTPLREFTAPPYSLVGFQGAASWQERREKERMERGVAILHFTI